MNRSAHMVKTEAELNIMRANALILKAAQNAMKAMIAPGVTPLQLNAAAEAVIRNAGAEPSFAMVDGYHHAICHMRNEEVVHGIPNEVPLVEGDLISIDCGAYKDGFHSDAAFSLVVGGEAANPGREKFHTAVKAALEAGCKAAVAGARVGAIGAAVSGALRKTPYSVIKEYTGHGLGRELHEDPYVYNYGTPREGITLVAGMVLAIEPIVARGKPGCKTLADGWTVVTKDGRDACQWEHFGIVQEGHFEILA